MANHSDDEVDQDKTTISNWLFERRAFVIGRILMDGKTEEEEEINKMIKLYDELTEFCWPPGWRKLVSFSNALVFPDCILMFNRKTCRQLIQG